MKNLKTRAQDTATSIVGSYPNTIRNAKSFDALDAQQKGNITGVAFEGLSNARVQAKMEVLGRPVDIIKGDGFLTWLMNEDL